jgi:hypothetical protein
MQHARLLAMAALTSCLLAAAPAAAQSGGGSIEGLSDKLDEALRDLVDRVQPALDDLRDLLDVFEQIDAIENYQRPEILPNGDIIIRRRPDAPLWEPLIDEEGGIKT